MHKIYKTSAGKLKQLQKPTADCWIDITSPTPEDIADLKTYLNIPEDVLISVKDTNEVPKVEDWDDFQFILIQTPFMEQDKEEETEEYSVSPLGILYNKNCVITISDGKNDVTGYLKTKLKNFHNNKIINTAQRQQLIMKLLLFSSKLYLRYLKEMNKKIISAQEKVEHASDNRDILNLMDVGKALAYFNRALRSNLMVVEKLAKRKLFKETEDDEELAEDVLDETKQAIETVKIYEQIVSDTRSAFATIISNNLSRTVQFLTSITIIIMLPTLVASIYGMNVALPFQDHPYAFWIVMGIITLSSLMGVALFYRKKLF